MASTFHLMAPFPLSEPLRRGIRPGKTCDAIQQAETKDLTLDLPKLRILAVINWAICSFLWHLLSLSTLGRGAG